jgi:isoleucyl-tRNA synthetase
VTDNIRIFLDANEAVSKAVDEFEDYIKTETLAVEIIRTKDDSFEKVNINDHMTGIRLERITEN